MAHDLSHNVSLTLRLLDHPLAGDPEIVEDHERVGGELRQKASRAPLTLGPLGPCLGGLPRPPQVAGHRHHRGDCQDDPDEVDGHRAEDRE